MSDPARDMWDRLIKADKIPKPNAWIQWKGTNVCMDVHCSCGHSGHVDDDFAYFYRCVGCEKIWAVGQSVRLHELSELERAEVVEVGNCIVEDAL